MIDADEIERAARSTVAGNVRRLDDLVRLVQREDQRVAPTLFSAWSAEGRELTGEMRAVIEGSRRRTQRHRQLLAALAQTSLNVRPIKGQAIAAMYPDGIERETRDVDLLVPDLDSLWPVAAAVCEQGFTPESITLQRVDGVAQGVMSLHRPISEFERPDNVDIATLPLYGNVIDMPPRHFPVQTTPSEEILILLLEEQLQHRTIARELVDATLLLRSGRIDNGIWRSLEVLEFWPEWSRLIGRLGSLELIEPARWLPRDYRRLAARARRRRLERLIALGRRPLLGGLLLGQRAMLKGGMNRFSRLLWNIAQRRVDVAAAWHYGLPIFGFQVDSTASTFALHDRAVIGSSALVGTPMGTFVVTTGDTIDEGVLAVLLGRTAIPSPS